MKIVRNLSEVQEVRHVHTQPSKLDPLALDVIDTRTGFTLAEEVLRSRLKAVCEENRWTVS